MVIQNGDSLVERDAVRVLLTPSKRQPLINRLLVSINMKTLLCMFLAIKNNTPCQNVNYVKVWSGAYCSYFK